jgi:type I restriction enzyme R subunit
MEKIRRRDLPHWDVPYAAYFITSCLEGSIPAQGLLDIDDYRAILQRRSRPTDKSEEAWTINCWKLVFARTESWLDMQPAVHHLSDTRLAQLVVDAFYFFAGQRYDLLAFVVMPSHIHWVFQPLENWVSQLGPQIMVRSPRERIIHSINRHTAAECNQLLGLSGTFWQHESYDHWIRDAEEMERIIRYVEGNPVKAGLVDCPERWPYSSAWDRKRTGTEIGMPLVRRVPGQVGNLPPQPEG